MPRRSPLQAFLAASLVAVLVSGYAGPALCAAVHGQPASHQSEHCPDAAGQPGNAGPIVTATSDAPGCPDAAHCGVGLSGPLLRHTALIPIDLTDAGSLPAPALGGPGVLTGPPSPPPKV